MKKLLTALLFLTSGTAVAQQFWDALPNTWSRLDGGNLSVTATAVLGANDAVNSAPVNGSVIVGNNSAPSKWAAVPVGAAGTYAGTVDGVNTAFNDPLFDMKTQIFGQDNFCGVSRGTFNSSGSGCSTSSSNNGILYPCTRNLTVTAAVGMEAYVFANTAGAPSNFRGYGQGPITMGGIFALTSIGDGTDVMKVIIGLCDQITTNTECTNGIYFLYDRTIHLTDWVIVAATASAYTRTDTGIAVNTGNMQKMIINVNAAGTSVTCSIGGVACTTAVTTNIPPSGGVATGFMAKLDKTAGTTTANSLVMANMIGVQHGLAR